MKPLFLTAMLVLPLAAQSPVPTPALTANGAFFALSVPDRTASTRWYREKLGLQVIMDAPRSDQTRASVTVLRGGGLTVELVQHDDAAPRQAQRPDRSGAMFVHGIAKVGVQVEDFDAALANLRARGVDIAMGPFPKHADQPANVIIRDNAGNLIQILGKP
ncbi:MAG: VOC family protein [Gemmatimonadaceae bacterium]